ncbi:hypothetical protein RIF29_21568 [Crotalaria pallida]|uniref:Uncharacterized protein n=1 Tax=Crotalaria pallida TaxID=3830 RepID=A0AAN9F386_CROPI
MWCELCSRVPLETKPRLTVDDDTSQAIFNVLDRDSRYMLGMSCAELMSLYYSGQPEFPPTLPPCPSALDLPMLSLKRSYSQIQSTADVVQLQPTVPICQSNDIELVYPVVVTSCPSSNQTYVLALPAKKPKNE